MRDHVVRLVADTLWKSTPRPGRCYRCQRIINEDLEFRGVKNLKEWHISHLCQQCQDWVFQQAAEG